MKKSSHRAAIAAHLRKLAGDRTASDLARELGVTPQCVGYWFSGKAVPVATIWPKLAKAFGLKNMTDLFPRGIVN